MIFSATSACIFGQKKQQKYKERDREKENWCLSIVQPLVPSAPFIPFYAVALIVDKESE